VYDLDEDLFTIVDPVIEEVVQVVEGKLLGIGTEPSTGVVIDDYTTVPDFGTLAFNDGYVTKEELEAAREELEEKKAAFSSGLTIDRVLADKKYICRKNLSRIFIKTAMIESRILDRDFGQTLLDQELVSIKDLNRAFRMQLENFEASGTITLVGDILADLDVLDSDVKEELLAAQNRDVFKQNDQGNTMEFSSEYGAFVDLQVSDDRVSAWIRVPKSVQGSQDITPVMALIKKRGIKYGLVQEAEILNFLKTSTDVREKLTVAQGIAPSVGKPGQIKYYFDTEPNTAGVVLENGSIDYKSRGDSAFVNKGTLLAKKIAMEHPRTGRDVFGQPLEIGEIDNPPLNAGEGTQLTEDGLTLTAENQGHPVLDADNRVSVVEQFIVNGDVDYKSGNVIFNGNVLVKGSIKEGFSVECTELTCNEIDGGTVKARIGVNASNGIINSHIETRGHIQAKFLTRSKIYALNDVTVTKIN